MASLYFKILSSRKKASGKLNIYLAVSFKHEVRYISTEFEIDDESQFENGKVCYRKDAALMNKRMQYVLAEYKEKLAQLNLARFRDCVQLKEALTAPPEEGSNPEITISELFNSRINRLRAGKRMTYAKMNEYSRDIIVSILHDIPVSCLTRKEIKQLDTAMFRRGFSSCNVQMRMAHLKAAINEAVDEGLFTMSDNPFRGYTMPTSQARMMDVSQNDFRAIRDLSTTSTRIQFGRDMWLISFYLGGINLADLVEADLSGNTLTYQRKKTRNKKTGTKDTMLAIQPEARQLINRYIGDNGRLRFPYRSTSYTNLCCYLNKCLKLLAAEVGISQKKFSFYSARKTFAQFAFELGIRTEVIEYCIGQSMKANRPIYNYVRVMQRYADEAIRQVIDYASGSTDAPQLHAATIYH